MRTYGSLALALSPGAEVVEDFVRRTRSRALISYDPNIRPGLVESPESERHRVERQVRSSDVVKASLDDVQWLYPDFSHEDVAAQWLAIGPSLVVITLGGQGAYAFSRSAAITFRVPKTRVIDTVGAGDAFTAGLLAAIADAGLLDVEARESLAGADDGVLKELVRFASAVAAVTCGRAGADPPTRAELDRL